MKVNKNATLSLANWLIRVLSVTYKRREQDCEHAVCGFGRCVFRPEMLTILESKDSLVEILTTVFMQHERQSYCCLQTREGPVDQVFERYNVLISNQRKMYTNTVANLTKDIFFLINAETVKVQVGNNPLTTIFDCEHQDIVYVPPPSFFNLDMVTPGLCASVKHQLLWSPHSASLWSFAMAHNLLTTADLVKMAIVNPPPNHRRGILRN